MKISEALLKARQSLDESGVSSSKLDSLILLSHAISFSKEQIIFNPDFNLNNEQQQIFFALIKRRAAREPVSHILEKREFYGEDFFVSKDVLDPRPDSEILIEEVFKFFSKEQKLEILELGVGSGCLIITLLKAYKEARGVAVDISPKALEVAIKNAHNLGVKTRLNFVESNLFANLTSKKFDLIISNPPYIASHEINELEPEVRIYEPLSALDGGIDGLDFYRKIAKQSTEFLKKDSLIILEIGIEQGKKIIEIFSQNDFMLINSSLDLSGIERVLSFRKK